MIIRLSGRISSDNAAATEKEILEQVTGREDKELILDASDLEYISSAGLRVILRLRKTYPDLRITGVNSEVYEILEMTGFTELMNVKKRLREVSVDGCPVIGRGYYGTVYRLDVDTIVKVYEVPDSLAMIENEQNMAKEAFIKGIPTAISYDMVKVGDQYGSVFELLKATTFNDELIKAPENIVTHCNCQSRSY